jgi:hypothetical protein
MRELIEKKLANLEEASDGWKLLGTSPNLEMMKKLIAEYFYGSDKNLKEISNNEWQVLKQSGEVMDKFHVIKSRGRFRFEVKMSK